MEGLIEENIEGELSQAMIDEINAYWIEQVNKDKMAVRNNLRNALGKINEVLREVDDYSNFILKDK